MYKNKVFFFCNIVYTLQSKTVSKAAPIKWQLQSRFYMFKEQCFKRQFDNDLFIYIRIWPTD